MKKYIFYIVCFLPFICASCKKDKPAVTEAPAPAISKVTPAAGQPGDTITIEGANFGSRVSDNDVAIHGVPAQVVSAAPGRIQAVIPSFCLSGSILLTVNNVSAEGPALTVIPAPGIKTIAPAFAFAGDTLTITGEHFAESMADNHIVINGTNAPVVKQIGTSIIKVLIPDVDGDGSLQYSTFSGKKQTFIQKLGVRHKVYKGNLMEAVYQDPAFSYSKVILQKMQAIYPAFYNDIAKAWTSAEPHTVFLRDNSALQRIFRNYTSDAAVQQSADPQIFYYMFLWQTMKGSYETSQFESMDYLSVITEETMYGGPGQGGSPDIYIPITISIEFGGPVYAGFNYSPPVKLTITNLKATNGVIHQFQ